MLELFKHFVTSNNLVASHQITLLTVSGGIDSVVMASLFQQAGFPFAVAHCNFKLRDEESDADEIFVKNLAYKYQVPFFSTHFDTTTYATDNNISIQMAARDLRYSWFQQLAADNKFGAIATAHHQNDAIETVLINFARGTGIAGLHGILPKQNNIIRPLLFATREQIEVFANEQQIAYRNDSSNNSNKYIRNKIRLEIIPVLKTINPSFENAAITTINHLRNVEEVYNNAINDGLKDVVAVNDEDVVISLKKLNKLQPVNVYLYELLKQYGFNATQVTGITTSLNNIAIGRQFFSASHCLVIDRTKLIITEISKEIPGTFLIAEHCISLNKPFNASLITLPASSFRLLTSKSTACLDADLLQYPLSIRKWQDGDFFYPLGMDKKKKVSDFFINNKYPLPDKKKLWILTSNNNDLLWIIGKRIDDRYKVTPATKRILVITIHP